MQSATILAKEGKKSTIANSYIHGAKEKLNIYPVVGVANYAITSSCIEMDTVVRSSNRCKHSKCGVFFRSVYIQN